MNSTGLYDLFRSDVADTVVPYLWSDTEVFAYMNEAYRMFVRKTGGIPDATSATAQVAVVASQPTSTVNEAVLRIVSAYRVSDGLPVKVLNNPDFPEPATVSGAVREMVIGEQDGLVRWTTIPLEADTIQLTVYRMPAGYITGLLQDFTGVHQDHHLHLLDWMKHLAYKKQDAETFDRAKSEESGAAFLGYCEFVKAEIERRKHKTRVVAYGGL